MSCRSRIKSGMTDPASRSVSIWKTTGFRVRPGMTDREYAWFWLLQHSLFRRNDVKSEGLTFYELYHFSPFKYLSTLQGSTR